MSFLNSSDELRYRSYYTRSFDHFYAEESVAEHPAVLRAREVAPDIPFEMLRSREEVPAEHRRARTLLAVGGRGNAVGRCPGTRGHICCNYLTVDLYTGCNLGCSYCIMQSYLNFSPITVRIDTQDSVARLGHIARLNAGRLVRAGTGETGDSLWLDPLFNISAEILEGIREYPNLVLELKTKTNFVDHLLGKVDPAQVVFGFSLNPTQFAEVEEPATVPPALRLAAAERSVQAGYRVAFHFDPIVRSAATAEAYAQLCTELGRFPSEQIAWISMGTIRYPKELRDALPDRPYLLDEFVPARDGKYRYLQRDRVELYRAMLKQLRAVTSAPVYLCMESDVVWRRVFGGEPQELPELRRLFEDLEVPSVGEAQ